jgi:predicted transcriptional regulator
MKKRVTLYLDEEIHKVLKLRAAQGGSSISDTVSFAVETFLVREDEEQSVLETSRRQAARGETIAYEEAVARLRRDGLL